MMAQKNHAWAIGVDLGGTKTKLARVTAEGRLQEEILIKTDVKGGASGVMSEIITAVQELKKTADSPPVAIGLGVAGQIDEERGVVRFAPNLGWHDVPLGTGLSSALNLPVIVMNDVRSATWGEWLHGAGKGCDDLICIFVGTGIGGGVIIGGRMLKGCTNTAGEIGHMTIQLNGPRCTCRNSGCLEALAGGWAIARKARNAIRHDPSAGAYMLRKADGVVTGVTAEMVGQAFREGDFLARRIVEDAVQALAAGCVSLVNAFNPCRLIVGGGVMEGMPQLIDEIREAVQKSALSTAIDKLEVLPSQLRNDAGVIGIAAYALRTVLERKAGKSAA